MKVTFLMVLLLLIPAVPLLPLSFSTCSDGTVGITDDDVVISVSGEEFYLELPLFSFGAMEKGGILYSLDHPYSSVSITPSLSRADREDGALASCFTYGPFSLFSFFGERAGMGAVLESGSWTAGALYASAAADGDYQKSTCLRIDRTSGWLAAEYDGETLFCRVMSSFSGKGSFSSLGRISLKVSVLTFSCGMGKIQAFSKNADEWSRFLSASITTDSFSLSHKLWYGDEPLYLREYRDYEYRINGRLCWGDFVLSDTVSKKFSDGKTERREQIEIEWNGISLGWKTDEESMYFSLSGGGSTARWEDGKLVVSIRSRIVSGKRSFSLNLSSSGSSSWIYTYEY